MSFVWLSLNSEAWVGLRKMKSPRTSCVVRAWELQYWKEALCIVMGRGLWAVACSLQWDTAVLPNRLQSG